MNFTTVWELKVNSMTSLLHLHQLEILIFHEFPTQLKIEMLNFTPFVRSWWSITKCCFPLLLMPDNVFKFNIRMMSKNFSITLIVRTQGACNIFKKKTLYPKVLGIISNNKSTMPWILKSNRDVGVDFLL